jgi:hypothetical protein
MFSSRHTFEAHSSNYAVEVKLNKMKGKTFLQTSIPFDIKSYVPLAPARGAAVTALSYLEFLRVATLTAAVGQIVRQGRHKTE